MKARAAGPAAYGTSDGEPGGRPAGTPDGAAEGTPDGTSDGRPDGKSAGRPDGLLAEPGLDASRDSSAGSATHCGPELASPDGVEAQTCVVTEGADVWARTYYRNATGQALDAVLTLMAPAGRTVQVRCAVEARDEPEMCETPKERSGGAAERYSAVTEFAGAGEGDSTPLLLRSGSNTAEAEGS
ncbi:hypothetical protein [Streptomyces sp. NPDC053431]|uniref:hypothetical protein n=1 Tax=Streptomyces sp. NPDC053431 TaxID=3365703 RepID=UPI0037CF7FCF